jgi:RNA polymerase sigma-70 factor (ECF subfamily)
MEEQMSDAYCSNLNEGNVSVACLSSKNLASAEPDADMFLGSQPLSEPMLCGDNDGRGESDDDLITAAQQGDQQAFMELCERYSYRTKRAILHIVRNQEDAEDALQEALLRAYTHIASFRRSCKFSTWLTTIGVNSALIMIRKRKVHREIYASAGSPDMAILEIQEPVDPAPGPEETYLRKQAVLVVAREVEKLPSILRCVINHYYGSECSVECSAKALDISVSAAKSRLMRGRHRLRVRLGAS